MADILAIVSGLTILGVAFPALWIILRLTFPAVVERASQCAGSKPGSALLKGLLAFILIFLLAVVLGKNPHGLSKFFSLLVLLTGLSLSMLGGAGLVDHLAGRFKKLTGTDHPILELFSSAILIELASVLPLVGWFVVLPVTFLIMLGSGCEALLKQRPVAQTKEELKEAAI
jgi:hypothetical protein